MDSCGCQQRRNKPGHLFFCADFCYMRKVYSDDLGNLSHKTTLFSMWYTFINDSFTISFLILAFYSTLDQEAFLHGVNLWYGKAVDCSGWSRWIVMWELVLQNATCVSPNCKRILVVDQDEFAWVGHRKICLPKLQNLFLWITKCISPNCKRIVVVGKDE